MMKVGQLALGLLVAGLLSRVQADGATSTLPSVSVASNGVGDLLLAPVYLTGGGWKAELNVRNLDSTYSTVAKVVLFGQSRGEPLGEFLI
jgi:hypothetical protein